MKSYSIYFHNPFTRLAHIDGLTYELGHRGTGTIRENKTEKCLLEGQQVMKIKSRGYVSTGTMLNISPVRWHDNNFVRDAGIKTVMDASLSQKVTE